MQPIIWRSVIAIFMVMIGFIAGAFVQRKLEWQKLSADTALTSGRLIPCDGDNQKFLLKLLHDERVTSIYKWDVTGENEINKHELTCVVREFDADPDYDGRGVKLSIFDDGKIIFEDTYTSIGDIQTEWALREESPQLALNINYGGNANFVQILEYREGKIAELLNEMHGSGYEIRPQFRSGVHPAIEPYQVTVISDGLASSHEKFADVYRYQDGEYVYVGKYSQRKVDDYIERLLSK